MPCFNHANFIAESANGILDQTQGDLELIIIDDASSDNSWEIIQRMKERDARVRAIRHPCNRGASKSRNDGLRIARGSFIGFCDADDVWTPEKLRTQMLLLENNPDYDVTYCDAAIIDECGTETGQRFSDHFPPPRSASGWLCPELIRRNFINMQSVLMRRHCMQISGYFDEKIKWVEDWHYWMRLSRAHKFLYQPAPLARYRVHRYSTNRVQKRGYGIHRFKVFRKILKESASLPRHAKADISYQMGIELCEIDKRRIGYSLLWKAMGESLGSFRALPYFLRSCRRLLLYALHSLRK